MPINMKKVMLFLGLTFSLNYLMVILYLAMGGKWVLPGSAIIGVAYMFVPMLVALWVQKGIYREPIKEPLGISFKLNRWFLAAWLLPPLIALATLAVSLLFPGVSFSPEMAGLFDKFKDMLTAEQFQQMQDQMALLPVHPIWLSLLQGLVAGVTVNAVAGFGEELGWRGFLQRELSPLGFWRSTLLIGFIWGIWHAPIILQGHNYPQHPVIGVGMMTLWTMLLAPIIGYISLKAKSVIAAAVFHGTLNGTYILAVMTLKGGSDLTVGVSGLAGFLVLALVNLVIFLYPIANHR